MRATTALAILGLLTTATPLAGQQTPAPPPPAADTVAPTIPGVVKAGTRVQVIKEGFQGTEGPIALPDGSVVFTETNASRIVRIDARDTVSTFLETTNGSNAIAIDGSGRFITVQTVPGKTKVGVIYPAGREAVLAEGFAGRPNDLVVTRKGGVYFTVPGPSVAPGTQPPPGPFATAVYFIPPGGKHVNVAEGIENPNGITLSRDEKIVYVNNTRGEYLLAFDIRPDGTLTNRRNFAKYDGATRDATGAVVSGADGLAIDSAGRLYAATTVGVQVFSDKGLHLGTIPISRAPQNLAFAGTDKKTLYVVGRGAAYKIRLEAQGFKGRSK